jgi:methionyl-tRNA formyltransferase
MDEGIDTGDIILQREYAISDLDNYNSLLKVAHKKCAEILYDAIKLVQSNQVEIIRQNTIHPTGFYCSMRISGDELLDWNQNSREIFNFIRAISKPGPMARTFLGSEEILINGAVLIDNAPCYIGIPGQIVGKVDNELIVKTKDSTIRVTNYIFENRIRIGDRLK